MTIEQLAHLIESSSKNGHNVCIRASQNKTSAVTYFDLSSWLSQYFETLKGITNYQNFVLEQKNPSVIVVKEHKDSFDIKINLTKKKFPFGKFHLPKRLPKQIFPEGLSLERQWYLYDKIRCHILLEKDKNETCPKPKSSKLNIKN